MLSTLPGIEELRELFPIKKTQAYFSTSVVGPLSLPAYEALVKFNAVQMQEGCKSWPAWAGAMEEARPLAAQILDCPKDNVAFVANTATGILLASRMIDWKPGDEVIVPHGEFPANVYPWLALEPLGVKIHLIKPVSQENGAAHVTAESIGRLVTDRTRAISVSFVQYDNGCRRDLKALGEFCNEHGIAFVVDAIQGLGALPVSATACGADFIVAGAQKWLLSPPGTGLMFVREKWLREGLVPNFGWFSVSDPYNFAIESCEEAWMRLSPTAHRLEAGTPNFAGIAALGESLKLIISFGVARISARIRCLTDRLVAGAQSLGCTIISPRSDTNWSGIVSLTCPKVDSQDLQRRLWAQKISTTVRQGWLRAAVHFFNDESEIDRLLEVLASCC